ncbi:MAG: hypothetical protein JSS29_17820 [Proteobacteria bacterium]|nr:hypothetical protein [Pseudomonadota bacterium]
MKKITAALLAALLLGPVSAAQLAPDDEKEFAAAWDAGQKNEHDGGAGAAYIQQMVRSLGPALSASMKQCSDTPADPDGHVRLVFQLALDGSIRKIMAQPRSPRWDCVTSSLAKKKFAPPPRDDFWTSGTVR